MIVRFWLVVLAALGSCVGCGGGWSESDAKGATDAVHLEAMALSLCAPDGDACAPGQVRALERAAYCLNASALYRHGLPVLDAGVTCSP